MLARIAIAGLLLAACAGPPRAEGLRGSLELGDGVTGAAYLFLYPPGEGPPARPGPPRYVSAISRARLSAGDRTFVFADVAPGSYRLTGFLDVDGDASLDAELLLQPTAGDRPLAAQDVVVEEGTPALTVSLDPALRHDPPAFRVDGAVGTIILPELAFPPSTLEVVADPLGRFDAGATRLVASLSEDRDLDGQLDLYPQIFLRFRPRPGQNVPTNGAGEPGEVIVPTTLLSTSLLALLAGDPAVELALERLTVVVVPQAQAVFALPGGGRAVTALPAVPVGDYELVVVAETGQVWTIPNALGAEDASQAVRFIVAQ